jgi:MFS family permease
MTIPDAPLAEAATDLPAAVTPPRIARLLIFLLPACTGLLAVYQGIQQILIPAQIEALDPAGKVGTLALLTTFVAITSMIGIPLGGALSDRTRSRFGRRTMWIVGTSIVSGVLMVAMGFTGNLVLLGALYTVLWLTANMYQGALLAVLPDRVPVARRGWASALIGLATPLGVLVGVNVAGQVGQVAGYVIIAVILVVTALAFVLFAREGSSADMPRPERQPLGIRQVGEFFSAFRARDYTLAFVSRFALFLSYATVSGFLFYTLSDYIGKDQLPGGDPAKAVASLLTYTVAGWVIIATVLGWVADKVNRRKLFVGIAAIGLAVTMFVPILMPTWTGMLVYSVLLGVFIGTYFAVDLAVMSLVLPNKLQEGRDLGILNVAVGLPTILSGAIAGGIITFLGGYTSLYVFGAVCALVSGVVVLFIKSVR